MLQFLKISKGGNKAQRSENSANNSRSGSGGSLGSGASDGDSEEEEEELRVQGQQKNQQQSKLSSSSPSKQVSQKTRPDCVAILHSGGPYAPTMDRLVRSLGVHTKVFPLDIDADALMKCQPKAIIISGGPASANDADLQYDRRLFALGLPILGICLGMQILAVQDSGRVEWMGLGERKVGQFLIDIDTSSRLFQGMQPKELVCLTHDETVVVPGEHKKVIAKNTNYGPELIAAFGDDENRVYGVQFHPEGTLTQGGVQIFKNFIFDIAGVKPFYTDEMLHTGLLEDLRRTFKKKKKAVLFVSSDFPLKSFVCAALLHEAIGTRLTVIYIHTGFTRTNDNKKFNTLLKLGIKLMVVDVSMFAMEAVQSATSAKEKVSLLQAFVAKTCSAEMKKLKYEPSNCFVVQSTLRSETFSNDDLVHQDTIRVSPRLDETDLALAFRARKRLLEPLKTLHVAQVEQMARLMGLGEVLGLWTQQFAVPPTGLATRIISTNVAIDDESLMQETRQQLASILSGECAPETEERVEKGLKADELELLKELRATRNITASLLPFRAKSESNFVCCLHSTAPSWPHLFVVAKVIARLGCHVSRVVYLLGSSAPTALAFSPLAGSPDDVKLLQVADDIVCEELTLAEEASRVSNIPVILLPLGTEGRASIVLRPIITHNFVPGRVAMPGQDLREATVQAMHAKLAALYNIQHVLYDLTASPISTDPASIEWEY